MSEFERKLGVGCGTLLKGGTLCGKPFGGLCSRCWAIQNDEDAATLREQLQGAVEALRGLIEAAEGVTETRNYDAAVRWRKALDAAINAPTGGQ